MEPNGWEESRLYSINAVIFNHKMSPVVAQTPKRLSWLIVCPWLMLPCRGVIEQCPRTRLFFMIFLNFFFYFCMIGHFMLKWVSHFHCLHWLNGTSLCLCTQSQCCSVLWSYLPMSFLSMRSKIDHSTFMMTNNQFWQIGASLFHLLSEYHRHMELTLLFFPLYSLQRTRQHNQLTAYIFPVKLQKCPPCF